MSTFIVYSQTEVILYKEKPKRKKVAFGLLVKKNTNRDFSSRFVLFFFGVEDET